MHVAVCIAALAAVVAFACGSCLHVDVPEYFEPSGMVFHEGQQRVYAVGDEGFLGSWDPKLENAQVCEELGP